MALSRTWYCDNNYALPDVSTAANVCKSFLYVIKALLVGGISSTNGTSGAPPVGSRWSVVSSSDSSTSGASDLWTDQTKVVRAAAGVAHSWVVLQSPTALDGGTRWYICIDYASAADADFILVVAKTAFSGGSTTARPTSTDELATVVAQTKVGLTTALAGHKLSRITDADGNFWIVHTTTGSATGFHSLFGIQKLANTRTGDTCTVALIYEHLATGRGAGGTATTGPIYSFATSGAGGVFLRSPDGVTGTPDASVGSGIQPPASAYLTATSANNADGRADGFPCIIYTKHNTGAKVGIRGTLPDVYITNVQNAVGTTAPSTGTPEHVIVGNLFVPNGTLSPTL